MDELAREKPDAPALVWCDEKGAEATFTYAQLKKHERQGGQLLRGGGDQARATRSCSSSSAATSFGSAILALHKLGAIAIPATHLLTTKDIVYRNKAADIKMIVTVEDALVRRTSRRPQPQSPSLAVKATLGGPREGWLDFTADVEKAPGTSSGPQAPEPHETTT